MRQIEGKRQTVRQREGERQTMRQREGKKTEKKRNREKTKDRLSESTLTVRQKTDRVRQREGQAKTDRVRQREGQAKTDRVRQREGQAKADRWPRERTGKASSSSTCAPDDQGGVDLQSVRPEGRVFKVFLQTQH